jgi:hypothetical protein
MEEVMARTVVDLAIGTPIAPIGLAARHLP